MHAKIRNKILEIKLEMISLNSPLQSLPIQITTKCELEKYVISLNL